MLTRQDLYGNENENMKIDPLRPVKHDCNGFSTVKYVPIRWDYNVLTLFSIRDAIENTALGHFAASGSIF